ncbi:MAG: hydantoinase/oxoprolinase family protein [Chromatiales bacterium]|jgi:N-methylhydantoinase A|nr:hydantoinase/oxoprolinase family protein [Chromatiales bacterium]
MGTFRIGVDIGGTFTDIVFLAHDGTVHTRKVPSTVDDYGRGIVEGVAEVFRREGIAASDIEEVLHGTTVASNAILEMAGAKTGLITTCGFRDVLELRTLRMPRLYDIGWEKPEPLVERYLRAEVAERVDAAGQIEEPLSRADVEAVVDRLVADGVEAIAVTLLNSFANPTHERLIGEVIAERAPQILYCLSVDVLPEIKEYERTSTTVINAYLLPVVARYLRKLEQDLSDAGVRAPLLLMQSNGGLTTAEQAARYPCHIVESGPAGGVVGGHALSGRMDDNNLITFDMGGTTAKASLVENGQYSRAVDYSVGAGIMHGSRLLTGAGYRLRVPAIDLAEVGAGGGSLIWLDAGGAMQIGPRSAGAVPGPVCYGRGGTQPTVTDANVVLGYLNPDHLVGGELTIDSELSKRALQDLIATPLDIELAHAAHGAHLIAAANMIRAIKAVSSERGRDPREYTLLAFGGNGPLFAATMARSLGMRRIVVPPGPGLFSAFGILYAEVEHHYSQTLRRVLSVADPAELEAAWQSLEVKATEQLALDGFSPQRMKLCRSANMHYKGQIFELSVPVASEAVDVAMLAESFGQEHERTYGHRAGVEEPVELVNVELIGKGVPDRPRMPDELRGVSQGAIAASARKAYFGADSGWLETPVLGRDALFGGVEGPVIVEEYDATCVVPPGAHAQLDGQGNIVITFG